MRTFRLAVLALRCSGAVFAADQPAPLPLTADAIMARVAANQDRSDAERSHYIYVQHARMTSRKGSKIMCEEISDYRATPSGSDSQFGLVKLDGRLWNKGRYIRYDRLEPDDEQRQKAKDNAGSKPEEKNADGGKDEIAIQIDDTGLDRDLVENMRKNLLYSKSKDGIDSRLFPLTSKAQSDYTFRLAGRERLNGHDVYHVVFRPKDKNDFSWKGDAYIDQDSFEPVLVTTGMSRKIPFAVRTFLGINLPGLGFTVVYAPQRDGVWFPSSFSTEFKIRVLFFFHREIQLNAENKEFEKTHSEMKMLEGMTPVEDPK